MDKQEREELEMFVVEAIMYIEDLPSEYYDELMRETRELSDEQLRIDAEWYDYLVGK